MPAHRAAALAALLAGCAPQPDPPAQPAAVDRALLAAAEQTRADARARGVAYRAVGQEPGWLVEITPEGITATLNYGERIVHVPPVAPSRESGGILYDAQTEAARLRLVLRPQPCRDVMSGLAYPDTATLTVDGRTYQGCGEPTLPR